MRWTLAALHLLALGVGLGAVWTRARLLRRLETASDLRRLFAADSWWGVAALVWLTSGALRAFGGLEKGTDYYLHNRLFLGKMSFLVAILILEIRPMVTLIRWRMQVRRGELPRPEAGAGLARTSYFQTVLVVLMVIAATGMARGYGAMTP